MNPRILQTRHVLAVNDLDRSARHYIDVLGFTRDFAIDGWEFLSLGHFKVMLGECQNEVPASQTGNHSYFAHVMVNEVDALFQAYRERGATFLFEVEDKPWGMRE